MVRLEGDLVFGGRLVAAVDLVLFVPAVRLEMTFFFATVWACGCVTDACCGGGVFGPGSWAPCASSSDMNQGWGKQLVVILVFLSGCRSQDSFGLRQAGGDGLNKELCVQLCLLWKSPNADAFERIASH
ncbi:hypothetical protein EJB05_14356 [Eragrostis curvula]|uniref:Uncharacterized protein n=1 Tax=Eragrostis curvula TaxID=38414 RepID=A0A5J9VZ21_9POAL|nr:hypothetical protein EJB05_14356 [Eragrostis curvula]